MPAESELNDYLDHAAKVAAVAYHAATRDGSIPAISREAVADIRNSIHEMFFGKSERGGQPGTPGNPLFHDIVEARNTHETALGTSATAVAPLEPLPSPGQIIAEDRQSNINGPQQQGAVQGNVHGNGQAAETARGSVYGPEKGVLGPEHGVYGPEHGVAGRQANAAVATATPGEILRDDERGPAAAEQGREMQVAEVRVPVGPFTEQEAAREKAREENSGGGYQPALERSKADEQRVLDPVRGR
jgi:hypothetical protein